MFRDDWDRAIGRALVERSFRARLLTEPANTLAEYGLAASEAHVFDGLRARTLAELVAHVVTQSPKLRHGRFDGYRIDV